MSERVEMNLNGNNQWTPWLSPTFENPGGDFNVSVGGSGWSAIITVQRTFDNGVNALDVDQFTGPEQAQGSESEDGVKYRIGIKPGDYTSGDIPVRISK